MPRQPGPSCLLAKYILMYKHFTEKARDHRRPLDETQGGGGGGGGGGGEGGRMPTSPAYPN